MYQRILAYLGGVSIVFLIGCYFGFRYEHSNLVSLRSSLAETVAKQNAENESLKSKLEEEHAQANNALNYLLDHPAQRVQLPVNCTYKAATAKGSKGADTNNAASQRTDYPAQEAFDRFAELLEQDAAEYARILNACSVVVKWANQ